jgi:hypothetical protein
LRCATRQRQPSQPVCSRRSRHVPLGATRRNTSRHISHPPLHPSHESTLSAPPIQSVPRPLCSCGPCASPLQPTRPPPLPGRPPAPAPGPQGGREPEGLRRVLPRAQGQRRVRRVSGQFREREEAAAGEGPGRGRGRAEGPAGRWFGLTPAAGAGTWLQGRGGSGLPLAGPMPLW